MSYSGISSFSPTRSVDQMMGNYELQKKYCDHLRDMREKQFAVAIGSPKQHSPIKTEKDAAKQMGNKGSFIIKRMIPLSKENIYYVQNEVSNESGESESCESPSQKFLKRWPLRNNGSPNSENTKEDIRMSTSIIPSPIRKVSSPYSPKKISPRASPKIKVNIDEIKASLNRSSGRHTDSTKLSSPENLMNPPSSENEYNSKSNSSLGDSFDEKLQSENQQANEIDEIVSESASFLDENNDKIGKITMSYPKSDKILDTNNKKQVNSFIDKDDKFNLDFLNDKEREFELPGIGENKGNQENAKFNSDGISKDPEDDQLKTVVRDEKEEERSILDSPVQGSFLEVFSGFAKSLAMQGNVIQKMMKAINVGTDPVNVTNLINLVKNPVKNEYIDPETIKEDLNSEDNLLEDLQNCTAHDPICQNVFLDDSDVIGN